MPPVIHQSPMTPADTGTATVPVDGGWAGDAWASGHGTLLSVGLVLLGVIAGAVATYLIARRPGKTKADMAKRLMYVPLLLVNGAAIYGQVAFFYEKVAPTTWPTTGKLALAAVIAAAIESISVYVGWHAHDALMNKAGKTAAQLRRASYVIAAFVASINYAHFADFTPTNRLGLNAAAAAFGLLSLLSPWLWGLHTRRMQHVQLRKEGVVDAAGATFSGDRIRSFPLRSWLARRWSIDNYVTDPKEAWQGYNASLREQWGVNAETPGWWMRVNPVARVRQLVVVLEQQRAETARKAAEITDLNARNADLDEALTAARNTVSAVTANRDATTERIDALNAELTAARNEINDLNEKARNDARTADAERTEHALTVERLEARIGSLESELTTQAERLNAEHNEAVRELKADLNKARAEAATVDINRYRKAAAEKAATVAPNRAAMSDEDAVQAMYDEHNEPGFKWSQNAVRKLTGAGWGRIPGLINAWHEKALNEGGGDVAVNE